ncbi:DsbA family protein [Siculibacillus lacustris]|uniref:DsbA family protein n=1 Tax=Siculibacillus lacustris TaxID=1549641 RepID=A0A4Q9VFV5_9HYPH|nr:DsbA family protein [Siculibacillus lacustris]TBW33648.1 DsbA family protein [Siculibacillus lacustris]
MPSRLVTSLILAAGLAFAVVAPTAAKDAPDKAAIEKIVHDYLVEHPEVIEEAMAALEKKQAAAAAEGQAKVLAEKAAVLFDSKRQVVLGNPKGDVTLVEFFDYNCGYCKRALPDMLGLIDRDRNLRIVLKEFPVLGPGSVEAAKVAVAVEQVAPEKYLDFHKRLLGGRGEANRARALEAANGAGVDSTALDRAMADREVPATLEEVYGLATGLGLSGTPSYVIGDQIVPGAVGIARLEEAVGRARCAVTRKC